MVVLLGILGVAGCAVTTPRVASHDGDANTVRRQSMDAAILRQRLYAHYREWQGVRYQDGGLSHEGIDCSGFVYLAFNQQLGLELPRTTSGLAAIGEDVALDELGVGDLVFFRTGGGKQHVGIYIENGLFLHASTSKGVTLSRLNNRYWRSHYWRANRILF